MPTRPYLSQWIPLIGLSLLQCGQTALAASDDLGSMSLTELMNEPVTSVSKKETKLSDAAAAITVITQDDLRRLGITSLPDALRLVPGMDVAQISSNAWAVTARGFNGEFANKLLVLVDGRTVYTPSTAGVYWNAQDLMLEDIERIEVIRGPGATLWGSNAVNGVINITTKRAQDTQGVLVSGLADSEPGSQWAARYGANLGGDLAFRAYAKYLDQAGLANSTHTMDTGGWHTLRGGFRADWDAAPGDAVTVQGDAYGGRAVTEISAVTLVPPMITPELSAENDSGENILARWTHSFTADSVLTAQGYVDHALQGDGASIEHRTTYDVDIQHRFTWGPHDVVWGAGYRSSLIDNVSHNFDLVWNPPDENVRLFNFFAQDDVTLVPDRLRVTLGAKYEDSSLVSDNIEPNARVLWTPVDRQAIWAAISRATRTPALFELNGRTNIAASQAAPDTPIVLVSESGNPALRSEEVLAYEIGYRYTPARRLAVDISTYLNDYTHVIVASPLPLSFETIPAPPHLLLAATQVNGGDIKTYGTEATVRWQANDALRITLGYAWIHIDAPADSAASEGTASQQAQLRSYLDLPHNLELNTAWYYVGPVIGAAGATTVRIPAYVRADVGVVWHPAARLSMGIWGRNLLQREHVEFASFDSNPLTEIPRSVLGKITWSF